MTRLFLLLGTDIVPQEHLTKYKDCTFYLAEDRGLCTPHRPHSHALVLEFGAQRQYADVLRASGKRVLYRELLGEWKQQTYEEKLAVIVTQEHVDEIVHFPIQDSAFANRVASFCAARKLIETVVAGPHYLTDETLFVQYCATVAEPALDSFTTWQRARLGLLLDASGTPLSSVPAEPTRIPPDAFIQPIPLILHAEAVQEVIEFVQRDFPDNAGDPRDVWLPTNTAQAQAWLEDFLIHRFPEFATTRYALSGRYDFSHHGTLSPLLDAGLLTPSELVHDTIGFAEANDVPLQSVIAFIDAVIGAREFAHCMRKRQSAVGTGSHSARKLAPTWFSGDTGLAPLDIAIKKATRLGYLHASERALVQDVMRACDVPAAEQSRWTREHLIASGAWHYPDAVTVGSAELLARSDYAPGFWCDILDGLLAQPALRGELNAPLAARLQVIEPDRKKRFTVAAEAFLRKNVIVDRD